MLLRPEGRSLERLRAHWEVERELAARLMRADREARTTLYGEVYDELFQRVPDHPQLRRRASSEERRLASAREARFVSNFLAPGETFLEIGAGDCALSLALASRAARVYAVEVSREIAHQGPAPSNFELLITDGRQIPVTPGSVDLVYSNQLMEHLHPDDAIEQLGQVVAALRPGGRYLCMTPNRLIGPSDISMYFRDDVADGFHLREYTWSELAELFERSGLRPTRVVATLRDRVFELPIGPFRLIERWFERIPLGLRRRLKRQRLVRKLLSPAGGVIAVKASGRLPSNG